MKTLCRKIEPQLLDFARGRLSPAEAAAIERHLDACSACRATLNEEVRLAGALERLPAVASRRELWGAVGGALREAKRPAWSWSRWLWLGPAGAAAAAATLVIGLQQPRPAPSDQGVSMTSLRLLTPHKSAGLGDPLAEKVQKNDVRVLAALATALRAADSSRPGG